MSGNPLRSLTKKLDPYWKNHPNQRDFWHGLYHHIQGEAWRENGYYEEAREDFKRRDDHWIRHENLRQYQERTGRSRSKSPRRDIVHFQTSYI